MKRIKTAALVGAAALVLALVIVLGYRVWSGQVEAAGFSPSVLAAPAQTAQQCLQCHEMVDQVNCWQGASHHDINCLTCHAEKGVKGWWQVQFDTLRRRIAHARGDVHETNFAAAVPNERCLSCHGDQMPYVMEDYQPPKLQADGSVTRLETAQLVKLPVQPRHDLHLSQVPEITCTTCHTEAGHRPEATEAGTEASHATCNNCHRQRQVTVAADASITCQGCHLNVANLAPADHQTDWRQGHGAAAVKDGAGCAVCHVSRDLPGSQPAATAAAGGTVANPAQGAPTATEAVAVSASASAWLRPNPTTPPPDACENCHQLPMPHPATFMEEHARAYTADPAVCARCHFTAEQGFDLTVRQDPNELVKTPFCRNCHVRRNPHPASDVVADYAPAATVRVEHHPAALPTAQSCQTCHSGRQSACATCHKDSGWHPADWVATHRNSVWQQGPDSCRTCHSAPDACVRCHHEVGTR